MGIFDFLSPPAANIPPPQFNTYDPTGIASSEANTLGGIGNLGGYNLYGQYLGQAQGVGNNLLNNPYAGQYQAGAGTAAGLGQNAAMNSYGQGGNLYGLAGSIANTAFDPQGDLYNRTVQQVQDQSRAGQAARGIATTPYGAGLEDQNLRNFNMDWQNQQLQRQIQGGQAAGGLIGQGAGLQNGAASQYYGASALPYQTYQGIGQGQLGTLGQLGQFGTSAAQLPQQQIQDWSNYLGWGLQAQNAGNQAQQNQFSDALNQDKQAFGQQQSIFGGLGQLAGGLWNTGLSGGGTLGSAALSMFSDERVKEDIVRVGELHDGQPVFSYHYKGDPTPRIGLIAQEVEKVRPDAVSTIGGIKAVDYGKATEFSRGIAALSAWG